MTFKGHILFVTSRDTNKLYARQKSFGYQYYQYTRPNHTNSFNISEKMFNRDETIQPVVWKVI